MINNNVSDECSRNETSHFAEEDTTTELNVDPQSHFVNIDNDVNEVTEAIETIVFDSYDNGDQEVHDDYDADFLNNCQPPPESEPHINYSAENVNHNEPPSEPESHIPNRNKPYTIIRGSINQANIKFRCSAGKQCTAMAASAIATATFVPIENWKSEIFDVVLDIGNNLYEASMDLRRDPPVEGGPDDQYYLEVSELCHEINVHTSFSCSFNIQDTFYGKCFDSCDAALIPLEHQLKMLFEGKNNSAILTMNNASVAIISSDGFYYLFDSHSRNEVGAVSYSEGKSCVCCFETLQELFLMIVRNMYIDGEENTTAQRNIFLLAIIEISNSISNNQCYQLSDLSSDERSVILRLYIENLGLPKCTDDTSAKRKLRDPSENTSSNSKASDPTINNLPNSESNNPDVESASLDADNETSSSQQNKKKRRRVKRPRSSFVDRSQKKLIIELEYFWKEANESFYDHRVCSYDPKCRELECHLKYIGPIMNALQSTVLFECSACEFEFAILSEPEAEDIARTNDSILLGCISSGIGFYQLEELLTVADLLCHNYRSYNVAETVVGCFIMKTTIQSMAEAAKESDQRARAEGRVTKNNTSYTTVITDGTYQKRSYASGLYNSSSGAAIVLDKFTNKILDVGVANKRCSQCQFGNQPYHLCWQNYSANLSSTRMESAIILELFQTSLAKYKLIYEKIVSDGDTSVPQLVSDNNPYREESITVVSETCMNHVLRRLSTNLRNLLKCSQLKGNKKLQNAVTDAGVLSSKAIRAAARHLMSTNDAYQSKVKIMQEDLENMPYHAFGQHQNCKPYYCDKNPETNYVLQLIKLNLWNTVTGYYARIISIPKDVLANSTNNPVECANNIIATKIGGKRIDFCKLGGYTIRVAFAVTQYNSKSAMCDTFTTWGKRVPERLITLEKKKKEKVEYNNRRYTEKGSQSRYCKKGNGTQDCYYGPKAGIKITPDQYEKLLNNHRDKLQQLQNDRVKLERETIDQAESDKWHTTRRLLVTASKFKDACRCRTNKTKKNVVKTILYPSRNTNHPALIYGKNNEAYALDRLEENLNIQIEPCGLFIDDTILGFGASPDGLVGPDGIVEIKCPYSLRDTTAKDAIEKGLKWGNEHFKNKDPLSLRKSSSYYYQIQGQLHITRRQWCILSIWTQKDSLNLKIQYDGEFWTTEMFPRLNEFYWKYLVPELLNPTLLYGSTESEEKVEQSEKVPKIDDEKNDPLQEFYYGQKQVMQWFSLTPIVRLRDTENVSDVGNNKNQSNGNDSLNMIENDNIDDDINSFMHESENDYLDDELDGLYEEDEDA